MSKKAGKRTSISDMLKREICAFHKDNMLQKLQLISTLSMVSTLTEQLSVR